VGFSGRGKTRKKLKSFFCGGKKMFEKFEKFEKVKKSKKSGKDLKNWGKSGKIRENQGTSGKIREPQESSLTSPTSRPTSGETHFIIP
jgi:hypothetical protein